MNSYNENLHDNVVTSLQSQEIDQKKLKAQRNAAMFTLYYTEGARITAADKLVIATGTQVAKAAVKEQAVNNSNISNNLLGAANQAGQYLKQSVTNTAVAASNVQIAANAVVRLAGDIGSIFSIVNAADSDTEIFTQCQDAYSKINDTAYQAELASQMAMESSMLTSEVSSPTLTLEAKSTNDSITNILKIAAAEFDMASGIVAADNSTLAAANTAEKIAEGILEDINVEYNASNAAYALNNQELNLALVVTGQTNDSYTVNFNNYTSPFDVPPNAAAGYPVRNYNIMLVKNSKKSIFSASNAETIVSEQLLNQFVSIAPTNTTTNTNVSQTINIGELLDTDGETLLLGEDYVVFVLVNLLEDYKKIINNFDDYLSAPSPSFCLTNPLAAVTVTDISSAAPQTVEFTVTENAGPLVEYRCMFLLNNSDITMNLLTAQALEMEEATIESMEQIEEAFDPQITALNAKITSYQASLNVLNKTVAAATKAKTVKGITPEDSDSADAQIAEANKSISGINTSINDANAEATQLNADKTTAINALTTSTTNATAKIGFFFNLNLALQVPAGNYTPAQPGSQAAGTTPTVTISPETTDNFGNFLVEGQSYTAVFLSVCAANEPNPGLYSPAMSDLKSATAIFEYSPAK